jgi:hypothetical protein
VEGRLAERLFLLDKALQFEEGIGVPSETFTSNVVFSHSLSSLDQPGRDGLPRPFIFPYRVRDLGAKGPWAPYRVDNDVFMAQLEVQGLRLSFGGLTALNGISLSVTQGEIFAIIGPNGAGKICVRYVSDIMKDTYHAFMMVFQALREGVFGLVIILFLIFEPDGLASRWQTVKSY